MERIFGIFFILLILGNFVSVQGSDAVVDSLEENLEDVENFIDDPRQETKDYLRKERTKFFEKSKVGQVILFIDDFLQRLNLFFKPILGVEYSLSFLFLFVFILWIFLFVFIYRIFHLYGFFSEWVGILMSFLIMVIISTIKIPLIIGEGVANLISVASNPIVQITLILLVIVVLALSVYFSKVIEGFFKDLRERRKKIQEEMDRMELKAHTRVARTFLKSVDNAFKK